MDPGLRSTIPLWIWYGMTGLCVRRLATKGGQPSSLTMRDTLPGVLSQKFRRIKRAAFLCTCSNRFMSVFGEGSHTANAYYSVGQTKVQ